jgi:endonuclease/exonuclease/phosphatase family metal-dependent hydrolase
MRKHLCIALLVLAFVLSLFTAAASRAAELKIATWNLNWLTSREGGLPADVKVRQPEDFDRLRAYALELNADVIAIEEVDNAETARRVFPADVYSIHMSRDRVRQRVGIAVRRGLHYDINPDVTAIALEPVAHLRSGVDITINPPAGPLRVLAVHLKQGCQYLTFGSTPHTTCVTLMSQFDVVAQWIAARRGEGVPFLVLGDFNRGMDKNDPFSRTINGPAPLTRATEGYTSPCWGHESFIDHILIGGAARDWVKPNSMRVLAYRETEPSWKERLSDHCPVSVRLAVPD